MKFAITLKNNQTVAIVGSGISGLMDAFALHQAGFNVKIYTKSPDPTTEKNAVEYYSSTRNGLLGRFISRFEGEHYLGDSPMYPDMKKAFQTHVTNGGWLGKLEEELTDFDKKWLKKRWTACDDRKTMDKTEKFYVTANGQAMKLWQELITHFPQLFEGADLLNTGILRLYDSDILFTWAVNRHRKEKVLENELSPQEVASEYPYFKHAVENNYVAGGLEAPGFSFNIHKFTDNIIKYLKTEGVIFNWRKEILKIQLSKDGLVEGLLSKSDLITAAHYVINPGAYAEENLFIGTPAEGKIAGVCGRWLIMPSPKAFRRPVKIHGDVRVENGKSYPVVDVNLTHFTDNNGQKWLAVGGGYAYLGKPPFKTSGSALDLIDSENERTVRRYLGPTYEESEKAGLIQKSQATCGRSFTPDDVPIMDNMKTSTGGILRINAGTNTGTTTIAPYMALKTVESLKA